MLAGGGSRICVQRFWRCLASVSSKTDVESLECAKPLYLNGRYVSPWRAWQVPSFSSLTKVLQEKDHSSIPSPQELDRTLPVLKPNPASLADPPATGIQATWLGHASLLIQMNGINILTDPVFGDTTFPIPSLSPNSFKRYRPVAMTIEDLPHIDAVLISHNHYDHLDSWSVARLNRRFGRSLRWLTPMGLKKWFHRCGCNNVREFIWWEEELSPLGDGTTFTFVPSQHWCKRGIDDTNKVLWGGWVVRKGDSSFYFVGDTAYCEVFSQIGHLYGPFTLAAIPIGAYEPRWFMKMSHINPEEAVQIHKMIRSENSVGIHWGTFKLTTEFYLEPRTKLKEELERNTIPLQEFITMSHGETRHFTSNDS
ncbi:N-acyl-phosphatidylethanolamine-hydrolyzing phospholipase D-like isoform X2 [Mizuhopecten yessoensis]|uniref:N-acyl-phosphatidylethanolamine-hydrolyzing phospholipase D-like isoform X2 n=1 Tax=Mizuhopecten yessoensis TaxID=6573 RepID=UPI000B459FFD|nr:N-acyl-phosphatidylethanolamine-hydrolyzing phospholipase D-like isoform X2 [Mizuhopecten yessoensis]